MATYSLEGPHIEYARVVEKKSDGSMTEYKYKNSFDPFIGDYSQIDALSLHFIPGQRINSSNSIQHLMEILFIQKNLLI